MLKYYRIRIATYNVNDRLPPRDTVELGPMVGKGEEDLLVFGFQEVGMSFSNIEWVQKGL